MTAHDKLVRDRIPEIYNLDPAQVDSVRAKKKEERGGFEKGIILEKTE